MEIAKEISNFVTQEFSTKRYKKFISYVFSNGEGFEFQIEEFKDPEENFAYIKKEYCLLPEPLNLGNFQKLHFYVFEVDSINAKIGLYKELKKRLETIDSSAILACFYQEGNPTFRLSLITRSLNEDGGIDYSSSKRQSFVLGNTNKTALLKFNELAKNIKTSSKLLEALTQAFSVENVTKEFYNEIVKSFEDFAKEIEFPTKQDETHIRQFILRMFSRILFCKFLEKKEVLPPNIWDVSLSTNYYHDVLEPLFFQTLNTEMSGRDYGLIDAKIQELLCDIPYLNGGLFAPQEGDFFDSKNPTAHINDLTISNKLFDDLFKTLNTFHFTIDESTPIDQEVGLDPEMLGMVFENLLSVLFTDNKVDKLNSLRKKTGSYYTPREIVSYMVKSSILEYLTDKTNLDKTQLKALVFDCSSSFECEDALNIMKALLRFKVLDPACGSGAFPMGMLQEICSILEVLDPQAKAFFNLQSSTFKEENEGKDPTYIRKLSILQNNIYGVDIQPMAIEIARLRCFLSLICEEDKDHIVPLPNLEFKFITANSLHFLESIHNGQTRIDSNVVKDYISRLQKVHSKYINAGQSDKQKLKDEFCEIYSSINSEDWLHNEQIQLAESFDPFKLSSQAKFFDSLLMFATEKFNCIIGNPPYLSTKGTTNKKELKDSFGFSDDLYTHFFFMAEHFIAENGVIAYITPNTFWTIYSKKSLREMILKHQIVEMIGSKNPFADAMVNTCITLFLNKAPKEEMRFIDTLENFSSRKEYIIHQQVYQEADAFFIPTSYNLAIKDKFIPLLSPIYKRWWSRIETSEKIAKNKDMLDEYRKELKSGDITLMGLLTDGGQGLATANNGKFVGVKEGTKEALRIIEARAEKLFAQEANLNLGLKSKKDAKVFLESKTEQEIRQIFDEAKEKFGRDVFGQGFLFRIVSQDEIADISQLTQEEKEQGIDSLKCFVPYDKGDKDGNRWYLATPYYIAWNKENVRFLKENSGKKGEGMPVVRNAHFYFREGFCWSDINSTIYLKCRLNSAGVFDVKSMTLFSTNHLVSDKFLVALMCSSFLGMYLKTFINNTVSCQINDIRQFPIIIPTQTQLQEFEVLFDKAYASQLEKFEKGIDNSKYLSDLQVELDKKVEELYGISQIAKQ